MNWLLQRNDEFYACFTMDGPRWTKKKDEAYRFPFLSMAQNLLENDTRVAGAEIVEIR